MNHTSQSQGTSHSLVSALRVGLSEAAWTSFAERYAPGIFQWVRSRGLQDSDAADVTQEVMVKILRSIRSFEYDPTKGKFRAWLKTIASNAARDWMRATVRYDRLLSEVRLQDIHWDDIGHVIENEYRKEILAQAEDVVRNRADSNTWAVYQMLVREGRNAADVAKDLKIPVGQVYIAKSRVLSRLQKAVAELMEIDDLHK